MNEHLKPVFETVLPVIKSARVDYWVHGGIAYAAVVGGFYRSKGNADVDIFVLSTDFESLEKLLNEKCIQNGWKTCKSFLRNGRPKIELLIKDEERLSIIPVYKNGRCIEFRSSEGIQRYSLDILEKVSRSLDGYEFFTPSDSYLKDMFITYLNSKNKYPNKRVEDARRMLSSEEFEKYFPNDTYSELPVKEMAV